MMRVLLSLLAIGCGSFSINGVEALAAAPGEVVYQVPTSVLSTLKTAHKGGTHYGTLSNNPKVINPILSADVNSTSLEPFLFATLFSEAEDNLAFLPYLAESYTISADKKTYTFTLSQDALWDDGTPVTTDDVKFSFDTLMNPKVDAAASRSYWEGIQLQVVDKWVFKYIVKESKFDTLRSLAITTLIQKKQFENEPDFNKSKGIMNPVGNGPYRLKSFSADQEVVFERKKDWWGNKRAHLKNQFNADQVVLRIIPDPNLTYERFIKGDIDATGFTSEQYVLKVKGTDKDRFGNAPDTPKNLWARESVNKSPKSFFFVGWNLKKPIFQSKKTRLALAMIFDYKQVFEKVYYNMMRQTASPFGALSENTAEELQKAEKMIKTDRKRALQLLKEDGWADTDHDNVLDKVIDGSKVKFAFSLKFAASSPSWAKVAQIFKENYKAAGIDVAVSATEWNALLSDLDKRSYDATIMGWAPTPYTNPKQIWHSTSEKEEGSNFVSYSNPKVDELIEKANVEFDTKKRSAIMKEINRIIYDDQPYLFIGETKFILSGFNKRVKSPSGIWILDYSTGASTELFTYMP